MSVDLIKYCKLARNYMEVLNRYSKALLIIAKLLRYYPHIVKECITQEELDTLKLSDYLK